MKKIKNAVDWGVNAKLTLGIWSKAKAKTPIGSASGGASAEW